MVDTDYFFDVSFNVTSKKIVSVNHYLTMFTPDYNYSIFKHML